MSKQPTVTIGIPALNEETNIDQVINDLLLQKTSGYIIKRILVSSDGSTDKTVDVVKSFKSRRVQVIDNPHRLGPAVRQNQLISACSSEIMILLDADIRITDQNMITKLIAPIISGQAELTSPAMVELPPRSAIEAILDTGMKLKTTLFTTWRQGQNGYLCHGGVRAFAKKFYSRLKFTQSVGEDMYSYLACIKSGFRFRYVPDTFVLYLNPANLADHLKQSQRFFSYHHDFFKKFDRAFLKEELNIPATAYIKSLPQVVSILFKYPLQSAAYAILFCFLNLRFLLFPSNGELWQASSTKIL